jgi:PAS domain S-box-containing protein
MSARLQHRMAGAAVLLILCVVGWFAYRTTHRLIENARQVAQTHAVLERLEALLSTLREAESGQRAYLLTGDTRHLRDYAAVQQAASRLLTELRSQTADNPTQQARLSALEPLIAARFSALQESIDARRTLGLPAAVERVRLGRGSQLMEALEKAVSEIAREERQLLESRNRASEESGRAARLIIGGGSLLAVALGLLAAGMIQFEINQRVRAEKEALESRAQLQAILDHSTTFIYVKDLQGRFVFINRPCREVFGLATGKTVYDYFPREAADAYTAADRRALDAGQPQESEEVAWLPDGPHTYLSIKFPLRDAAGEIYGLGGVSTDITERKRTERAMAEAREEAERVSRFKDQFLSTMSHELRTPLNAILGFSELLADERHGLLNDRQRRYVDNVHNGGQHLLRLINDILDLSKIEAGRLELSPQALHLEALFLEVQQALEPLAAQKSQRLSVRADPGLVVRADPVRLEQILMNLAGNAIKFTPAGGSVDLEGRQGADKVEISVRDTGSGIPVEEQKRIFEAFYRLRNAGQHTEGTGLGLAITQRLVELHGDTLRVESSPGQGSRFYFRLAPGAQALPGRRANASADQPGCRARVLVVEDDPVAAHLIQTQLESAGYSVTLCIEPEKAVEQTAQLRPDAITLDLLMKPLSGVEVLAGLKHDPRTKQVPIIVVTIVDEPAAGSLLGADEYLVKPVDKAELLAALARCLRPARSHASRTILVVEDDDATRERIAEVLRTEGYEVTAKADGAEARESIKASLPSAVILDLLLPRVNGFELLAEWRADPRTEKLPVIVVTGKDLSEEERRYLRTHTQSVFSKGQPWAQLMVRQLRALLGEGGG